MTHYDPILDNIETRQAVVAVIGLGYVGLPLAIAWAEAGFRVGLLLNVGAPSLEYKRRVV